MKRWIFSLLISAASVLILSAPAMPECVLVCPAGDGGVIDPIPVGIRNVDFNASGAVDLPDLAAFAASYPTAANPDAPYEVCLDFNCNGSISLADFTVFAFHYRHAGADAAECE